jgi:hypothetical protein
VLFFFGAAGGVASTDFASPAGTAAGAFAGSLATPPVFASPAGAAGAVFVSPGMVTVLSSAAAASSSGVTIPPRIAVAFPSNAHAHSANTTHASAVLTAMRRRDDDEGLLYELENCFIPFPKFK